MSDPTDQPRKIPPWEELAPGEIPHPGVWSWHRTIGLSDTEADVVIRALRLAASHPDADIITEHRAPALAESFERSRDRVRAWERNVPGVSR